MTGVGKAILAGGLIAGMLDIVYACTVSFLADGVSPLRVLQYIAGGLVGLAHSMQGGLATAILGLALHFGITLGMAAIFVAATRWLPQVQRWPIVAGVFYGLATWVAMNFVVVPLSAIGDRPQSPNWQMIGQIAAHIFLVGIPIALAARRVTDAARHRLTPAALKH